MTTRLPDLVLPAPLRRLSLFQASMAASFGVHALVFGWLSWKPLGPESALPDIIDVDIRTPFTPRKPGDTRAPGKMRGAPAPAEIKKAAIPVMAPANATPGSVPRLGEASANPADKPKDWVLPSEATKKLEQPTLDASAPVVQPAATAPGGTGLGGMGGRGEGTYGDGTGGPIVNRPPRLINGEEVRANLRRFYPEVERRIGREGHVRLMLEIDENGVVRSVDVVDSAGSSFDDAARSVARLMRFEPALKASIPTKVNLRVPIVFRLQDQ